MTCCSQLKNMPHPSDPPTSAFEPPTEGIEHPHPRCQQRDPEQQYQDIAKKNHHGGKQPALARDVRLPCLQNMKCERDVKRISRANDQIKEPGSRASSKSDGRWQTAE